MSSISNVNQTLVVVVSGGGPVGLTFSLNLIMMMGKNVKIIIYEGRWFVDEQGKIRWQDEKQGKNRRDQVVTLQDHVIEQMPEYVQKGLFQKIDERVWPTSRNIPIREVEDRLFDLIQPFVQCGQVELIPENLHEQTERLIKGDFDILVGTDGSNSFVRRYCNIQMISEGLEYACGVAYDIPDKVSPSDEPLHQALNCTLTVSQTRYLVNSSTSRRGYLNIRLIKNEYDALKTCLDEFQSRNEPLDLSDYNKCPQSPIWTIIRQGLDYFKISTKYVFRIVPIEINVRHASIVVRELRFEINKENQKEKSKDPFEKQYKTPLAFLAGDAAMNVHFWPGRGMNSGMKGAIALARNILRSCTKNNSIQIRIPLRFLDFLDYEGFMARLRAREQQGRSLRVLIDPIDKSIETAYSYAHLDHCYIRYKKKLLRKLQETRERLQGRPEWPHQSRSIKDDELESIVHRTPSQAVAQLSLANPWPTREMSGIEVLVQDTFPYDLKSFLPVPTTTHAKVERYQSVGINYRLIILWITGEQKSSIIDKLIEDIRDSPNSNNIHQFVNVQTIEEAQNWLTSNEELIRRPEMKLKVITAWTIKGQQTAIDVIRAVRSKSPRASVLIFTNKSEDVQPALEFPNVMATDAEFELKEYVGIKQEAQWSAGYQVSSRERENKNGLAHGKMQPQGSSTSPYPAVDSPLHSHEPYPPSFTFSNDNLSRQPPHSPVCSSRGRGRKPMLLWVDARENNAHTTKTIQETYPTLDIIFKPTFKEVEMYLKQNSRDIDDKSNITLLCRGYYAAESKNYVDLARLIQDLQLDSVPIGVYTSNRTSLLEKAPNPFRHVEIFDSQKELHAFIARCLQK